MHKNVCNKFYTFERICNLYSHNLCDNAKTDLAKAYSGGVEHSETGQTGLAATHF
jgi:hypothetical protein